MIDSACPTPEEEKLLKQHYGKTPGTISQRAHAILLSASGRTVYDIARILFLTEKTVRGWIKLWHLKRMASLFSGNYCNENASKLTQPQRKEIARVLRSPPSDHGIPKEFWDVSALREYVAANFGVVYESPQSYHFLFRISRFSFKLPAKFDIHRNDEEVDKRIKEIKKTIAPLLKDSLWEVLAGDESRIIWEAIIRRCWLPKGAKSILKVHRENIAQNFVGFLNLKNGKPHLFSVPWQNQKEIVKVLKQIGKKYPKKKICLIWDNAPWHRGKIIRERLKKELNQFYLLAFPSYAPDTNPQEHIWRWSKDQIANTQFQSFGELIKNFRKIVMGRIYLYQI